MWRIFGLAVFAAALIAPLACGGDSTGPEMPKTPVGSYTLASFNGKTPPVTLFSDTNYLVTLSSATLALTAEGSFQATSTVRETVLGHQSIYADTTNGTWIQGVNASTLLLTEQPSGHKVTAVWAGFNITLTDTTDGVVTTVVYTRK